MTHRTLPSPRGQIAMETCAQMDFAGPGVSQGLLQQSAGRPPGRDDVDEPRPARRRPALRDIVARAELDAGSDEAYFLAQLRAAVAAFETPADRLLRQYRG